MGSLPLFLQQKYGRGDKIWRSAFVYKNMCVQLWYPFEKVFENPTKIIVIFTSSIPYKSYLLLISSI